MAERQPVRWWVAAIGLVAIVAAIWSYATGGLVASFVAATSSDAASIEGIRAYLHGWGALAPVVYVAIITVEVVIAPLPGTILYAPAGAVFGAWWGGTLSLIGNTLGATVACLLAHAFGGRVATQLDRSTLGPLMARLRARGTWVVAFLRVNPFTSSDLVSYAAGLVGLRVWQVTLGTTIGMAPLCYLQSYMAEEIFTRLPAAGPIIVVIGVAYLVVAGLVVVRVLRAPSRQQQTRTDHETDRTGDRGQRE